MKKALPLIIALIAVITVAIFLTRSITRPEPDGRPKIALILEQAVGDSPQLLRLGAEQAAEDANFVICCEGPADLSRAREQIVADCIADGVAGVLLVSSEAESALPCIDLICEANIPCVVIGSYVDSEKLLCSVGADDYIAGLMAARRMGGILEGKGNVVVIKGAPGATWAANRANGFVDTIEREFGDVHILESRFAMDTVETASGAVAKLLSEHGHIDGLFACSESGSLGALGALARSGRAEKIKLVGCGCATALVDGLRAEAIDSLVAGDAQRIGLEAAKAVISAIHGQDAPGRINIELALLTKDNLDTPQIQSLLNPTAQP